MTLSDSELVKKYSIKPTDRILEIGGSMKQHEELQINTLVDIIRPEESIYTPSILKAKEFVRLDVTQETLPFKDKEFDFCLCTHTLEDLSTPFLVIREMSRVAKRGYIATPSMGKDMVFDHVDMTDYLCGPVRVPGLGHHKWFFVNDNGVLRVIPKNYAILYASAFHIVNWKGEDEMQFYWEKKIVTEIVNELNTHDLIKEYRRFIDDNKTNIRKGIAVLYPDNPIFYLKELIKLLLRRGAGFKYSR